jgi:hypothetical protein
MRGRVKVLCELQNLLDLINLGGECIKEAQAGMKVFEAAVLEGGREGGG